MGHIPFGYFLMEDAAGIKHHRRSNDEKCPFDPGDVACPRRFQEIGLLSLTNSGYTTPRFNVRIEAMPAKIKQSRRRQPSTKFGLSIEFLYP